MRTVLCYPEDIWRTFKLYATKLGMVVHHHEPECQVKRLAVAIFKVKVTVRVQTTGSRGSTLESIKKFSLIYLNVFF